MSSVSSVSRFGAVGPAVSGLPRTRPAAGGFDVAHAAGTAAAGPACRLGGAGGVAALSAGLLALQAEPESPETRARRRGRVLLASLGRLQHALLGGGDAAVALATLTTELASLPEASDPALRAVLADIALRVQVELALWESGEMAPGTAKAANVTAMPLS